MTLIIIIIIIIIMEWAYYPIADQCHASPTALPVSLPKYSLK
jgi:hypothetical protein